MRRSAGATLAAVLVTAFAAAAASAGTVSGSISGPVTSASGRSFVVKTTLSPTGSSKVSVAAKTTITEQVAVQRSALRKGECATATGTKSGSSLTAFRISLVPAVKGSCGSGFGFGRRPGTRRPPAGAPRTHRFTPSASFGFAGGTITAVKGSAVTVKGTKVVVGAKTQIFETKTLPASAIRAGLCAFVFGTSSNGGKTVSAQSVALSPARSSGCGFFGRRPTR